MPPPQNVPAGEEGWAQLTQSGHPRESEFSSESSGRPLESFEAGEIIFKRSRGLCVENRLEYSNGRGGGKRWEAIAIV